MTAEKPWSGALNSWQIGKSRSMEWLDWAARARAGAVSTMEGGPTKWVGYRAGARIRGLHSAPLSSAPTHVPVPRSLNCRTASPAVQCALRLHSQLHSVHPAQRHAVGLASKQALGWLAFKRHFLADTVCCVCILSAHIFSLHTLDLCGRALKRGRRLQFVQIYYRLASTMLRCTNVHESR